MTSKFFRIQQTIHIARHSLSLQILATVGLGLLASFSIESSSTIAIAQSIPVSQPMGSLDLTQKTAATILYVDSQNGNDSSGDGSQLAPFKTINRALEVSPANSVIHLAPGTYSAETGESFPISLKPQVLIYGNPATKGQEIIIRGGGFFSSPSLSRQNITILGGANQTGLMGVTVNNPNPNGYGLHIEASNPVVSDNTFMGNDGGILVSGSSASLIQNNFFYENRAYGVRTHGTSYPTIKGNLFEQSGTAILTNDDTAPLILNNRITQSKNGIVAQGRSLPQIRDNFIEGNEGYGLLALEQAKPDHNAGGEEQSNAFRNNGKQNIAIQSGVTQQTPQVSNVERSPSPQPIPKTATPSPSVQQRQIPAPLTSTPLSSSLSLPANERSKSSESFPVPTQIQPVLQRQQVSSPLTNSAPPVGRPIPIQAAQPQSATSTKTTTIRRLNEITSAAFPTPSAFSSTSQSSTSGRQIRIEPVESFPEPGSQKALTAASPTARLTSSPGNIIVPTLSSPIKTTGKPANAKEIVDDPIPAPPVRSPLAFQSLTRSAPEQTPTTFPVINISATAKGQKTVPPKPSAATSPGVQSVPFSTQGSPVRPPTAAPRSILIPVPTPTNTVSLRSPTPGIQPETLATVSRPAENSAIKSPTNSKGNLLPVPGPNIPVGNIGNMPSVYAAQDSQNTRFSRSLEAVSNIRYRVIVLADHESQQEQIRAIAPDAFPTTYQGRRALQVGAFGDPSKATQLVTMLMSQGLQATIESLK